MFIRLNTKKRIGTLIAKTFEQEGNGDDGNNLRALSRVRGDYGLQFFVAISAEGVNHPNGHDEEERQP